MRWRFADSREADAKAEVLRNIDEWWESFRARADDLDAHFERKLKVDVPQWVNAHLKPVDPRLCWEFGESVRGEGHRLVITPESDRALRPMVDTLIARAPKLPRWEFYAYRPRESPQWAHASVKGRVGIECPDATVRIARGKGNRIDLTYRSSAFRGGDAKADHAALVLTESLLGEEAMDKWVGAIAGEPVPKKARLLGTLLGSTRPHDGFVKLDRLGPTFDALVESIHDQLPDRPLHELDLVNTVEWTLYQLEPAKQATFPKWEDLFIGGTANMELTRSIGPTFQSCRFSRFGETFAYLKIDRDDVLMDRATVFRSRFEEAVEPALRGASAGCIHGNGTGTVYSYVELALTDVERSVAILRDTLRPMDVPTNTWLLFHDPELGEEWIGMYDDTPPPPDET